MGDDMDDTRREELTRLWGDETNVEETQAWREELTPEERDFVAGLDWNYCQGTRRLCEAIVIRDRLRRQYAPQQIAELTTLRDCCRLRLLDGRTYLVRLGRDNALKFQAVDDAC